MSDRAVAYARGERMAIFTEYIKCEFAPVRYEGLVPQHIPMDNLDYIEYLAKEKKII